MKEIDFSDKYAAIKIHFGEYGNLAFLCPNYAKVVADIVKEQGGKPFLTDCNTLYVGSRKNALDHMDTAYANGFSPFSTGCHVIIADGRKGTDEALVPVDVEYVKKAKSGQAIMDADIFISLTHFKGHEATGFGGALKTIGMGCGSRAGKMEMHNQGKPAVNQARCVGCGACLKICAHDAPVIENGKATIDLNKCVGCGRCIGACPKDAVHPTQENSNDVPIIPNVGMLASFDPVALDVACADLCNRQPMLENHSVLHENCMAHHEDAEMHDHFHMTHPDTNWKSCIEHAVKIGLGSDQYELIEI